ncbi:hypothetical protein AAT18_18475 [Rhodococcus aetherivorans]|nr:hypothetical protein AAT18_18475 [Rhodococcus aetherivorans]
MMVSEAERERRRARRTAAERLHPDVGGDAEALATALEAIDRACAVPDSESVPASEPPPAVVVQGRRALWRRHLLRVRPRRRIRPYRHAGW